VRRQLVKELRQRQAYGQQNLIIVGGKIVSRRQRAEAEDLLAGLGMDKLRA